MEVHFVFLQPTPAAKLINMLRVTVCSVSCFFGKVKVPKDLESALKQRIKTTESTILERGMSGSTTIYKQTPSYSILYPRRNRVDL